MSTTSPPQTSAPPARRPIVPQGVKDAFWPLIGAAAVLLSAWLLYNELASISFAEVVGSLRAIPPERYMLAALSTLVAYGALAWYDRIALIHLGVKHISWAFIAVCSFTTYALSHNIGASVFTGGLVRFRAYTAKGLTPAQVALLVAVCSFTFGLGTILLGGTVLALFPELLARMSSVLPAVLTATTTARLIGLALLAFVALYVAGSVLGLKPLTIRKFKLAYPRPAVVVRQLIAAPLELLGAAGIVYFALPEAGNPGYLVVLAVFLAAFAGALASHAPGGLGVFELLFITAMPEIAKPDVVAAVLVWRFFYLLIPLALSIPVVVLFEMSRRKRIPVPIGPNLEPAPVPTNAEIRRREVRPSA